MLYTSFCECCNKDIHKQRYRVLLLCDHSWSGVWRYIFQLIKGIFTKTIISPCFRKANDAKYEVQCIVKISKVFKVLFHTSDIDMKNRNCFLWEVFKTLFKLTSFKRVIFSFKKNLERVYLIMNRRSGLENYTSNSTRQHNTTRVQHETTRHNMSATRGNMAQQETTRHKTSKTRDNTRQHECNTTQHEHNTTQHEYKGSSGSKNRALLLTICYWTMHFLNSITI